MYGHHFLSTVTFWWVTRLILTGSRRSLTNKDVWPLQGEHTTENINQNFQQKWKEVKEDCEKNERSPLITKAFVRMYRRKFLLSCILKLFADGFLLATPYILGKLIDAVGQTESSRTEGILYTLALLGALICQTYLQQNYFWSCYVIGVSLKTAVIGAVYRKMFRLNNRSRAKYSSGKIINFVSIDAERCFQLMTSLMITWSAPLVVMVSLYSLFNLIGWSTIAGLIVIMISNPVNYAITKFVRKYNIQQMKLKDQRSKLMNEILSGIKIIKMYAWEGSFIQRVTEVRNEELNLICKAMILEGSWVFSIVCLPFIVSLVTFATYIFLAGGTLTAKKAFVSIAFFDIMKVPFSVMPRFVNCLVQYNISAKRVSDFLNSEEFDVGQITKLPESSDHHSSISIQNGCFSWCNEYKILENIDLKIDKGKLIAVIGQVGCGKSSLLSSILGEIEKLSGNVITRGRIAYVPQQAWIQNQSLRENILFGKQYRNENYKEILRACALETDIELLPASDLTEIGEKGINLSGGQKQRVSLARAVYENADIYLFDDPLSAVDAHVGKYIFENVIGPRGILRNKTRVLVTHNLSLLPQVDQVYALNDHLLIDQTPKETLSECDDHEKLSNLEEIMNVKQSTTDNVVLHSVDGTLTTKGESLYRVIDGLADEKLFVKDVDGKDEGKIIEKEKAETGNLKAAVISHYVRTLGIIATTILLLSAILQEAFRIASRVWLAHWSSLPLQTSKTSRNLFLRLYALLGFIQAFFVLLLALVLAIASYKSSKKLHSELLDTIMHCPMAFFEATPIGRIMNRFTKDINSLDYELPQNVQTFLINAMGLVGVVYVVSFATPYVMAFFFPIIILYIIVQRIYVKSSRQLKRIISINQSPIFNHFMESINGASTIRAFGKVDEFIDENHRRIDKLQSAYLTSVACDRWMILNVKMLGNFVAFFAALFCILEKGKISPGILGLCVSYAIQMTQSLISLVRSSNGLEVNLVSIERINDYISKPRETDMMIEESKKILPDWPQHGEISLVNYSVRYRPSLPLVLNNINITIKPKEKVGIVGRTGAGKSSITLALFRIIEASTGYISIDGVKISNVALQELRSKISIIPQDPVLFSGSIRFNVDPFQRHTDEQIWNTLEISRLKKFVSTLSGGLDSEVQEGGDNLSVGQRQLICLARALLRMSKILIMDEATASVDMETDLFIQQTIRKEFTGCTILTIAHRLNTIMDYDRILVMEKGEVAEFDSPKTLLADHTTIFYSMVKNAGLLGSI
ncbi:multidrug resistance-associated protein 1-like [Clytia hemisphaerica]